MKIYRASYREHDDEHSGYEFFSSKKEAVKKQDKENKKSGKSETLEIYEFNPTKKGIIELLNQLAAYPDNG